MRQVLADIHAVVQRFREDQGFLLAAALSYSLLLCLAPLALLFFSGLGFLVASDHVAGSAIEIATSLLPRYGAEVRGVLDLLNRERHVTGIAGTIGLAAFATPLFSLTRTAMNAAFRVQGGRGFIHGFAFDVFALAVFGLLAVAFSSGIVILAALSSAAPDAAVQSPLLTNGWMRGTALALLYGALLALLFFVYRTFPNAAVSTRAAGTATLITAAQWEVARRIFAAYLAGFETYGRLYGSFGVIAATLAWIYYSAAIFVLGAGIAAVLTDRYRGLVKKGDAPPTKTVSVPTRQPRPLAYVAFTALGVLSVLFAFENRGRTTVRLLAWSFENVPLAGVVLGALALGAVVGAVILAIAGWRLRSQMRSR